MENQNKNSLVALAISVVVLSIALAWGLQHVGDGIARRGGDTVSVRGTAQRNVKADRAVWKLSVSQSAETAADSVSGANASVQIVVDFLVDSGINEDNISLGAISTFANKEYIDGNATGRVMAYETSRDVIVRLTDVDQAAAVSSDLGKVLARGVTVYTSGPEYYLDSLTSLRPELLAEAMVDAKARAKALLGAVEAEVGDVRSVSSGPFQVTAADSTDVESGGYFDTASIDKTVIATVLVEFATN